jgi:phosphate-selective porin OprO/OprP
MFVVPLPQIQNPSAPAPVQAAPVEPGQPAPSDSGQPAPSSDQSGGDSRPLVEGGNPSRPGNDAGASALLAGWDNGFFLRSSDRAFELRITGQLQADYRGFLTEEDTAVVDTFLMRRARLGIEADMFKYYEFRLLPDFGQGTTVLQDAYMNVHYWDALMVEIGKFKQPFSYEQLIQDRYVPTMERSMIDQIVPARDVGVMIHGRKLLGDQVDYGISLSNGEINGNSDTNNQKDVVTRIVWRPLNYEELMPFVRRLGIGFSYSYGVEDEPMNPSKLTTPATIPWLVFNTTVFADGARQRYSPEITYFYGPFGFATQYMHMDQRMRPSVAPAALVFSRDVPFDGFYTMGTYLLTGESRTDYTQQIFPLHPFNPCHPCACGGAWELVLRTSRLHVGDAIFAPGAAGLAAPTGFSHGATELTSGFNWYLNAWVRVQFNYEHAWFDDTVRLAPGPAGLHNNTDTVYTRFQVIF